jgi:pimeloyl-ACP methyl ester carboxylesterase
MAGERRRRLSGIAAFLSRGGRNIVLLVVVALVGVAVVVPPALMWARVHPARVPLDDDPGRHGLRYEDIAFASPLDGTILRGWLIHAEQPTGRVVVVVPGIDSNRLVGGITLPLAEALVADGFDVLAVDLRAQGESDGDTLSFGAREQHDVLGAVAFARAHGARHDAVLGFSMGAAAAMLAGARTPEIDALVLDSAFADWEETLRGELRSGWHLPEPLVDYAVLLYGVLSGTDPGSVGPAEVVGALAQRPMLFIAGAHDPAVDPADGAAMAAATGRTAEYVLVPGAGHVGAFAVDPTAYAVKVRAFLADVYPSRP